MSLYNGPARGGNRGGKDQFNWDSVKSDKDREFYLGHSVKATTGRWQKGKMSVGNSVSNLAEQSLIRTSSNTALWMQEKMSFGIRVRSRRRRLQRHALRCKPSSRERKT